MTYKNINWDATAFFASLTETNKSAKAHDFVFAQSLFLYKSQPSSKGVTNFKEGV